MPFLVLKELTTKNVNDDSFTHLPGTVLSDWELPEYARERLNEGATHYRSLLEPLTEDEARHHRAKATAIEGDHMVDGQVVSPPWDDYVGLHPSEIIDRLKTSTDTNEVAQVKLYERGGMRREAILDYTAPVERAPFQSYDEMGVREVLDKLSVLGEADVQAVIAYEMAHRKRPAIISYEKETFDPKSNHPAESGNGEADGAPELVGSTQEGGSA